MKYKIQLTEKSRRDFLLLEKEIQERITKKFRFYVSSGDPLKYAKKLKNFKQGAYRFRIGDYRAIFDLDDKGNITILVILTIKHRKDAYL